MIPGFTSRARGRGRVAVGFPDGGTALVRLTTPAGAPPVLEACEILPDGGAQALARSARRHRAAALPCSIVADADSYSLLLVERPDVPPDELRAAVRWRIRELIDFHVDDAVVDVFDVPGRKSGGRPMMYVVAARAPRLRERTELAHDARLRLDVVDIPELAQRNVAAQLPEDVAGVALLHLAPDSGVLTITRQGTLYLARRLEASLTRAPAMPAGPPLDSAPDPAAAGDPPAVDAPAAGAPAAPVREWLDALVIEVQRSLDYYESTFAQPPVPALVVAPVERAVPGMTEYLAGQLGLETRALDLGEVLDCSRPLDVAQQARCFCAVGAALRAQGAAA